MVKHAIFGELSSPTLDILRMIWVNADEGVGLFTVADVTRPIADRTNERTVRELFQTMVAHELMGVEDAEQAANNRYYLTPRGKKLLDMVLHS